MQIADEKIARTRPPAALCCRQHTREFIFAHLALKAHYFSTSSLAAAARAGIERRNILYLGADGTALACGSSKI
jgi:hypothetical protein